MMVMRLTIIDSRATDLMRDNLEDLASYLVSCKFDIKKFHQFFDINYSALIARCKRVNDQIGLLFNDYFVVCDHVLITYMKDKQDEYYDNQAYMWNPTHERLMTMAMAKHNCFVQKGKWRQKYMEERRL